MYAHRLAANVIATLPLPPRRRSRVERRRRRAAAELGALTARPGRS